MYIFPGEMKTDADALQLPKITVQDASDAFFFVHASTSSNVCWLLRDHRIRIEMLERSLLPTSPGLGRIDRL